MREKRNGEPENEIKRERDSNNTLDSILVFECEQFGLRMKHELRRRHIG